jgi:hypothetical protein
MNHKTIRVRTTDGIAWTKKFRNTNDSRILFYMMQFEDENTEVIKFHRYRMDECSCVLKVSVPTIKLHLKYLIESQFLRLLDKNTYIINPNYLSVGSMDSFRRKMKQWNIK